MNSCVGFGADCGIFSSCHFSVINQKNIDRISSDTYVSQDGFTHKVAKEISKTDWLASYFFLMDDFDVLVQPRRC